jgi:8-oxo-dGTP pyrophosphatase MutT (NUDIX family)
MTFTADLFAKEAVIARLEAAFERRCGRELEEESAALRPAAVLLPLVWRDGDGRLVFTERTTTVRHHKGQVSFPGGSMESTDGNLRSCALREAEEELGMVPRRLLGALDQLATPSGFRVAPFVALLADDAEFVPDADEVARVIEIPLRAIVAGFGPRMLQWQGMEVRTDAVVWEGTTVWGVTAMILRGFLQLLGMPR